MVGNIWTASVRDKDAKQSIYQRLMVFNEHNGEKYLCGMLLKCNVLRATKHKRVYTLYVWHKILWKQIMVKEPF